MISKGLTKGGGIVVDFVNGDFVFDIKNGRKSKVISELELAQTM